MTETLLNQFFMNHLAVHFGVDDKHINDFCHQRWMESHDGQVMHSPFLLRGMTEFTEALLAYKDLNVLLIPDYDTDGITSGTIFYTGLKLLNFNNVKVLPPQVSWGFGLSENTIEALKSDYQIDLSKIDAIVTSDNGSASGKVIRQLRSDYPNLAIFITDHHVQKTEDFIGTPYHINPNRIGDKCPNKGLSGAAVAFKVIQALFQVDPDFSDKGQSVYAYLNFLLPLVGLSTVGDMMPMIDENRFFVEDGTRLLNNKEIIEYGVNYPHEALSSLYEGLKALIHVSPLYGKEIDYNTFGFTFSPVLNTLRRLLGDPTLGFQLFIPMSDVLTREGDNDDVR